MFKNIVKVVASNLILVILGLIISIVVPLKLTVEDYGNWQLFYMISGFLGVVMIGFLDGINLKFSGEETTAIDKYFPKLFKITLIWNILIMIILVVLALIFPVESKLKIMIIFLAVNIVTFNISGLFTHYFQITLNFNYYSIFNLLSRFIFVILIMVTFILKIQGYIQIILVFTVANIIVSLIQCFSMREIINNKFNEKVDILFYVKTGFTITLSSIISMLVTVSPRIVIVYGFGITEFSYYSFAITLTFLITQVINGVASVIYPIIRRTTEDKFNLIIKNLIVIINIVTILSFFLFYIIFYAINNYIPKYSESIKYLIYAFIIVIFQAKNSLILTTFYKAKRIEKKHFLFQLISLLLSLTVSYIVLLIFQKETYVIAAFTLSTVLCYYFMQYYLFKNVNIKFSFSNNYSLLPIALVLSLYYIDLNIIYSAIIYTVFTLVFAIFYRKKIFDVIKFVKK